MGEKITTIKHHLDCFVSKFKSNLEFLLVIKTIFTIPKGGYKVTPILYFQAAQTQSQIIRGEKF